jgi:predicted nucleic acid-binding protein
MSFVIDASVAIEYLLRTSIGIRIGPLLETEELLAPELIDAEILAVLRREVLAGRLREIRAKEAIDDLCAWYLTRIEHRLILKDAWKYRRNVSGYDSLYLAVARLYGAQLLTADGPLSRAPAVGVTVINVRS